MKKILVVDDDPVVQRLLTGLLERNGYAILSAWDGIEALKVLAKEVPDLMILDIMMPNMNGYDVCRAVKIDPLLRKMPIILLTSLDQEVQARFLQSLGIEYMHKTVSADVILNRIKKLIQ